MGHILVLPQAHIHDNPVHSFPRNGPGEEDPVHRLAGHLLRPPNTQQNPGEAQRLLGAAGGRRGLGQTKLCLLEQPRVPGLALQQQEGANAMQLCGVKLEGAQALQGGAKDSQVGGGTGG